MSIVMVHRHTLTESWHQSKASKRTSHTLSHPANMLVSKSFDNWCIFDFTRITNISRWLYIFLNNNNYIMVILIYHADIKYVSMKWLVASLGDYLCVYTFCLIIITMWFDCLLQLYVLHITWNIFSCMYYIY